MVFRAPVSLRAKADHKEHTTDYEGTHMAHLQQLKTVRGGSLVGDRVVDVETSHSSSRSTKPPPCRNTCYPSALWHVVLVLLKRLPLPIPEAKRTTAAWMDWISNKPQVQQACRCSSLLSQKPVHQPLPV